MNLMQNQSAAARLAAEQTLRTVRFYCAAPGAKTVQIAGDFNHWRPLNMQRSVDGWWSIQLEMRHGHHCYRFLVDGKHMVDPRAAGVARDEHNEPASLIAVS